MSVRSSDLSTREWDTLRRFQNRMPQLNPDREILNRLKALGLLEENKTGGLGLTKVGNKLLGRGRQTG
jgi:hypothetical protein